MGDRGVVRRLLDRSVGCGVAGGVFVAGARRTGSLSFPGALRAVRDASSGRITGRPARGPHGRTAPSIAACPPLLVQTTRSSSAETKGSMMSTEVARDRAVRLVATAVVDGRIPDTRTAMSGWVEKLVEEGAPAEARLVMLPPVLSLKPAATAAETAHRERVRAAFRAEDRRAAGEQLVPQGVLGDPFVRLGWAPLTPAEEAEAAGLQAAAAAPLVAEDTAWFGGRR